MGHRHASLAFTLRPVPPFRLDLTVWALRRRSRNLIDRWDGTTYRRVIVLAGRLTELAARQAASSATPTLTVTVTPPPQTLLEKRRVRSVVDRLLGLRIDLTDWYHMAAGDSRLRPLADTFRGMKPPRFPTMFEAVVNGFACQQLSLEVGLELLNRLATISSARFGTPRDTRYAFPTAQDIARLPPAKYRAIGFSGQKVRALLDLARPITRRDLSWSPSREKTTPWSGSACSNCAVSADGRPSTPCYEASDACRCSLATMWALRSDWLDGWGARGHWITPAFAERSIDGNPTLAWCISTFCSMGYRRPALWNQHGSLPRGVPDGNQPSTLEAP